MPDELVIVERHDDGVVVLTLDRPPLNALSFDLLEAIAKAAQGCADDPSVRAVVVTGNDKAFAAGADIKEFEPNRASAERVAGAFRAAGDAIMAIPRPVIAAIRGYALGGGLELALACDLRIASEQSRLGQPESLLGVIPGGGGTQRLARLVGPARAKEMIWSGRQLRAEEALAIGLVDRLASPATVLTAAVHLARELAKGPSTALGLAKRAIDWGLDHPLAKGLDVERECFAASFETEDAATGFASFREHGPGKAAFTGR